MAFTLAGAGAARFLVDPQAQGLATRFSNGQKALKFPVVCASTSNSAALTVAIGKRGRTTSIFTTNAVKKKAEEKQVLDGAAAAVDEHTEAIANGKPKVTTHLFEYEEGGPWPCSVHIVPHLHDVAEALADHIAHISAESINARGFFTIVLSGGSLVHALSRLLEEPYTKNIDWSKWYVFWADERVVPISHADSNYNTAKAEFLSKVPIPHENLITIDDWDVCSAAAHGYENRLKDLVKVHKVLHYTTQNHHKYPRFDLVLLGLGPDGHIASLFPNTLQLAETKKWVVAITKSPKPPSKRISLTLPVINVARHVAFVVVGSSKAEVLQRVFERPALPGALPAQLVRPRDGEVTWFVDKQAAGRLSVEDYNDPKKFPFLDWSSAKKEASPPPSPPPPPGN